MVKGGNTLDLIHIPYKNWKASWSYESKCDFTMEKMCFIIPTPILRMFLHVKSVLVMIWIEHLPTCAPKMME